MGNLVFPAESNESDILKNFKTVPSICDLNLIIFFQFDLIAYSEKLKIEIWIFNRYQTKGTIQIVSFHPHESLR